MRVACVGGGPGGLMLALLLRRTSSHEVEVFERSPAGASYGFGVVFSRFSLARLRRAAPDFVAALVERGASWGDIEVRRDGSRLRSSGHGYAAVGRRSMLGVLESLATQAGAVIHHDTEESAAQLLDRFDVVVAADGASSRTRAAHAADFGAHTSTAEGRYAWFGLDRAFDAMTFLFVDTEFGPLGAHVYPYGRDRSTFLVEAGEQTWQRAGFAEGRENAPGWNDAAAAEFCARAFAEHLGGARLLSNGSRWAAFPQVECARWSTGRIVGVGDAMHTAHFSVGSGTTLALEDAVELARRLAAHTEGDELAATFAGYESARRPAVEGLQQAAWASARMWSHPEEHRDLDPGALMLRLLARTGQSSAETLLRLDPKLAATCPGLNAPPDAQVTKVVPAGRPARLTDAVLLAAGTPPPPDHPGPLLVAAELGGSAVEAAEARLRELRAAAPDATLGVLVPSPDPAEETTARGTEKLARLARAIPLDLVALAPGGVGPGPDLTSRSASAERLTAMGVRTAYVCRPRELGYGWVQVRAGRADLLMMIDDSPAQAR